VVITTDMKNMFEVRGNLGLILRGDVMDLKVLMERIEGFLVEAPGVQLVHRQFSGSRLWMKESDEIDECKT
jgi:hypothetical protein